MVRADCVFINGKVATVDKDFAFKKAIAVKQGRVIDTGENAEIKEYIGSHTKVVDLEGKLILPAAHDAHVHGAVMGSSSLMSDFSFPEIDTLEKLRARIISSIAGVTDGEWVRGYGLNNDAIKEYAENPLRSIHHKDVDDVCPNHPIKIMVWSGHALFLNRKALEACGIEADTPDPPNGKIVRDATGDATGLILEAGGIMMVDKVIPPLSDDEIKASILAFQKLLNREGYTGYTEATLGTADNFRLSGIAGARTIRIYKELFDKGLLTNRVAMGFYSGIEGKQSAGVLADELETFDFPDFPDETHLKLGLIKLFCDGVHLDHTAWMLEDYADAPGNHGHSSFLEADASDEEQTAELQKIIMIAHEKGYQIGIHTIGSRAVSTAVDCLANAIQACPREDPRHYVLHADSLSPNSVAGKAAKFGILYSVQPGLSQFLFEPSMASVGLEKASRLMGLKELLAYGVIACGGSDAINGEYCNWRQAVQAAVTRRSKITGKLYSPELAITVEEAVRLFTINAVYQEHCEASRGSIEIGKVADFQVLEKDIFEINPEEIGSVEVLMTFMDGECVYSR